MPEKKFDAAGIMVQIYTIGRSWGFERVRADRAQWGNVDGPYFEVGYSNGEVRMRTSWGETYFVTQEGSEFDQVQVSDLLEARVDQIPSVSRLLGKPVSG